MAMMPGPTDIDASDGADELMRLARSVVQRLGEQVRLVRKNASIGDWTPVSHYCHDNVREWVSRMPHHQHVYGFIVFDLRQAIGCIEVMAHSAVEDEKGILCDITPNDVGRDHPFIRHTGTEEEFARFAKVGSAFVPVY